MNAYKFLKIYGILSIFCLLEIFIESYIVTITLCLYCCVKQCTKFQEPILEKGSVTTTLVKRITIST